MVDNNRSSPLHGHAGSKLLVSIHDVGPRFEGQVEQLVSLLGGLLGGPRFAMLVVPDHWGQAPLREDPAFCRKLRDWSDAGIEMFAHGWFHRDDAPLRGLRRFKASAMTAGEGEFLGLSRSVAAQRMADGKALIEDIIGRELVGFVAPAWLYGAESLEALRTSGFRIAEDHMRVWHAAGGKTLARGPVITWASRSRPRQQSSRAFAALARRSLHALPTVRIAVHPGDVSVPSLVASIRRTVSAFAARREAGRYRDLLPAPLPA